MYCILSSNLKHAKVLEENIQRHSAMWINISTVRKLKWSHLLVSINFLVRCLFVAFCAIQTEQLFHLLLEQVIDEQRVCPEGP